MDTRRYDTTSFESGCMKSFFQSLARFESIDSGSLEVLQSLPQKSTLFVKRSDIPVGSGTAHAALILIEGMAVTYKILDDGRRRVLSIIVPGEQINLFLCPISRDFYNIQTLQDCRFVEVSNANVKVINNDIGLLKALSAARAVAAQVGS